MVRPRPSKALRFASWASTDSVHSVDSVRSVTGSGPQRRALRAPPSEASGTEAVVS